MKSMQQLFFVGGVIIIITMDHTQLQPVEGSTFLLSRHVITCFKMLNLKTYVHAAVDEEFPCLKQIIRMYYRRYIENTQLLD